MSKKAKLEKFLSAVTGLYMSAIFIVVPLIVKHKYEMIGTFKYDVFRSVSIAFLAVLLAGVLVWLWEQHRSGGIKEKFSLTDQFVFAYAVCSMVSFLLAGDKDAALFGSQGWYMGLQTQLIFILSYFMVSRFWGNRKYVWYLACGAAVFVYLLGILHRFSIDPLCMYAGLDEAMRLQYLSVLGQSSWYSSYVCTLFPLGLFFFWGGKEIRQRAFGGIFGALGFATLVTQNSDSAFFALILLLLVLFALGFDDNRQMERFLETVILMLLTFQTIGLLRQLFPQNAVGLDPLSEFISGSVATGILLIISCCIYGCFLFFEKKEGNIAEWKVMRNIVLLLAALCAAGTVLFIVMNTTGLLQQWFGFTSTNNYLLFDKGWGNGRGRTWMFTADLFSEMPFYRKLFGAGPDCFASYSYAIPEYAERLRQMWGNDTLTNAHNEWANAVICYGIVGAAAYIGIFLSAFVRFWKNRKEKICVMAMAFCIVCYMGHNLFCYQQVLCTPFIFMMIGMGENLIRKKPLNLEAL